MSHSGYQSLAEATPIQIRLQTITGQSINVSVQSDSTVLEVKQLLENTTAIGVAPVYQRLIFCGSELQDGHRLCDIRPTPVTDGSTVQIFLRPTVQQSTTGLYPAIPAAAPINTHAPYIYPDYNIAYPNHAEDAQTHVDKSALNIRLFGIFFVVMGLINTIVAAVTDLSDWVNISIGGLLVVLGVVGVYAGVSRTTASARSYLVSIVLFIVAFAAIFIVSSIVDEDDQSTSNILVAVLVGIFFPLFLCSFCAFCANKHLGLCKIRDELEVQLNTNILPPNGMPFGAVNTQPLLGAV